MAARGCAAGLILLLAFLLLGQTLLDYFAIGEAAVEICGGILLFAIALEMLYGRPTRTGMSRREKRMAEAMKDVSVVPLGFPLLAGPGAITTCLLFSERADSFADYLALVVAATAILGGTFLLLSNGERLIAKLGDLGAVLVTRILGLVLAFLATQYAIEGLRAAFVDHS